MADAGLFGDDRDEVGPLVMEDDGEEWFPFTLENLEEMENTGGNAPCLKPMHQEAADYGETDSDNDVDSNSPGAGASGPGPPDYRAIGGSGGRGRAGGECAKKRARDGSNSSRDMSGCGAGRRGGNGGTAVQHGGDGGRDEGRGETSRQPCSEGLQAFVVPTSLKTRLDKVNRPTVKEEQRRLQQIMTETQAQSKRSNIGSRGGRVDSKSRQRALGGVVGTGSTGATAGKKDGRGGGGGGGARGKSRFKSSTSSTTTISMMNYGSDTGGGGGGGGSGEGKGTSVQNRRRLERNAREQKRSLKITQRIEDLRRMLSQFGVDVKTSKSAVLSEATDYIAHLQRQQVHFEAERARLLQLLHQATQTSATATDTGGGGGALGGGETAAAVVAAAGSIPPAASSIAFGGVGRTVGSVRGTPASTDGLGGEGVQPEGPGSLAGIGDGTASTASSRNSSTSHSSVSQGFGEEAADPAGEVVVARHGGGGGSGGAGEVAIKSKPQEECFVGDGAGGLVDALLGDERPKHQAQPISATVASGAASGTSQGGITRDSGNQPASACSLPSDVFPGLSSARGQPSAIQFFSAQGAGETLAPGMMVAGGAIQQIASVGRVGRIETPPPPPPTLEVATARALSHVNYERVFRTASVPMAIANVNGNLVDCNARLTLATGFQREEVLFMTIFDLVADPFLQHTFSMISSILNLPGVANPSSFQVLGKRRDGSHGGVVQVSVVQDEAFRPLHFTICVLDNTAGASAFVGGGRGGNPGIMMATPNLRTPDGAVVGGLS